MYVVRSFFSDSSTETCIDFTLLPMYADFCLMSSLPVLYIVVYYARQAVREHTPYVQ